MVGHWKKIYIPTGALLDLTVLPMKIFVDIYIHSPLVSNLPMNSWTETVRQKNSHW